MSSFTPKGKRRRLEQASNALSKPFKSPLRRPTTKVKDEATSPKIEEKTPSSSSTHPIKANDETKPNLASSAASTTPLPTPPVTRKRPLPGQRLTPLKKPTITDPEIQTLQKQQRDLNSRLGSLHSDLDTVTQALRIESSNRDDELEELITKWKKVSQDAAEEVYTGAQERMARMGGVKGWREQMKRVDNRWEQEEMESWFGNVDVDAEGEGEGLDGEEVQARKEEIREVIERKAREKEREKERELEDEAEEFTMDMMLKQMNIELGLIGYDKDYQRWIK